MNHFIYFLLETFVLQWNTSCIWVRIGLPSCSEKRWTQLRRSDRRFKAERAVVWLESRYKSWPPNLSVETCTESMWRKCCDFTRKWNGSARESWGNKNARRLSWRICWRNRKSPKSNWRSKLIPVNSNTPRRCPRRQRRRFSLLSCKTPLPPRLRRSGARLARKRSPRKAVCYDTPKSNTRNSLWNANLQKKSLTRNDPSWRSTCPSHYKKQLLSTTTRERRSKVRQRLRCRLPDTPAHPAARKSGDPSSRTWPARPATKYSWPSPSLKGIWRRTSTGDTRSTSRRLGRRLTFPRAARIIWTSYSSQPWKLADERSTSTNVICVIKYFFVSKTLQNIGRECVLLGRVRIYIQTCLVVTQRDCFFKIIFIFVILADHHAFR